MVDPKNIDKYRIISRIGDGGFGTVYRAFDRALHAEKAIKVLDVTDPEKFMESLEEAQILARCKHKHIVAINEANVFDLDGDMRVVLDLEYVPQGSLEAALAVRWISMREAVSHVRGALMGLEHAHTQGFLHRDIKPANILLPPAGAKLSDFGLATPAAKTAGSAQGYRTHLAPEYFSSHTTSVLTDVFAVGVTLYRAVSNITDWRERIKKLPDRHELMKHGTLIETLGFQPWIPAALQRIIRKACASDPAKRFDSAAALRQQLDRLRYHIDWIQRSPLQWKGSDGEATYEATVDDAHCTLTIKKNGRRITRCCGSHTSAQAAISALHAHIAETTLRK